MSAVWTITYRNGLMSPTDVVAEDEASAVKAGVAAFRYHKAFVDFTPMRDVVESAAPAAAGSRNTWLRPAQTEKNFGNSGLRGAEFGV